MTSYKTRIAAAEGNAGADRTLVACVRRDLRIERMDISGLAEAQRDGIVRLAARAFLPYGDEQMGILSSLTASITPLTAIGVVQGRVHYPPGQAYVVSDKDSGEMIGFAIVKRVDGAASFAFGAIAPERQRAGAYRELTMARILDAIEEGRTAVNMQTKNPVVARTIQECFEECRSRGIIKDFELFGSLAVEKSMRPFNLPVLHVLPQHEGLLYDMLAFRWVIAGHE
ncbi:MAG: hypothetical protein KGH72_03810 [Candidatus Micrarchaeota archaeon]|nr:hypothetical protein [Candidatus Micrarchaeota archaeon]